MIDIEFIVQFLVLRHAANYPEMTGDIGNIALLKLSGQLQLIDASLADSVANAYRLFRKMQHQIRMKGEDRARVAFDQVAAASDAVKHCWQAVLGAA